MYELDKLLGKVVTMKTLTGDEVMGTLLGIDTDNDYITLQSPKAVLINGQDIIIGPMCFSATTEQLVVRLTNVFFIVESLPESAQDYLSVIQSEKAPVIVEEDTDSDN